MKKSGQLKIDSNHERKLKMKIDNINIDSYDNTQRKEFSGNFEQIEWLRRNFGFSMDNPFEKYDLDSKNSTKTKDTTRSTNSEAYNDLNKELKTPNSPTSTNKGDEDRIDFKKLENESDQLQLSSFSKSVFEIKTVVLKECLSYLDTTNGSHMEGTKIKDKAKSLDTTLLSNNLNSLQDFQNYDLDIKNLKNSSKIIATFDNELTNAFPTNPNEGRNGPFSNIKNSIIQAFNNTKGEPDPENHIYFPKKKILYSDKSNNGPPKFEIEDSLLSDYSIHFGNLTAFQLGLSAVSDYLHFPSASKEIETSSNNPTKQLNDFELFKARQFLNYNFEDYEILFNYQIIQPSGCEEKSKNHKSFLNRLLVYKKHKNSLKTTK